MIIINLKKKNKNILKLTDYSTVSSKSKVTKENLESICAQVVSQAFTL